MIKIISIVFLTLSINELAFSQDYYQDCANKSNQELKSCLHNLIDDHIKFPYTDSGTDVWDILKETDADPNNPGNVILVYSGISTNAAQEYNSGNGWEREHVWSASHGDFERTDTPGTDVHHLKPILDYFNGSSGKWARDFDESTTPVLYQGNFYDCYNDEGSFEPRDAVKGDIARMIFYMAVRYEGDDGYPDLELVDHIESSKYPQNLPKYGKLSTLLQWHVEDPVDNFEMNRNEIIYSYQGNRNPFIDHPEYAFLIWN